MGSVEDIEYLEAILEDHPEDNETRLILADLYEGLSDPISETLRWMVYYDLRPWRNEWSARKSVTWNSGTFLTTKSSLPKLIFDLLEDGERILEFSGSNRYYRTVKAATKDLHEALSGGEN